MKITLISKFPHEFRVQEQIKVAQRRGIELQVLTIRSDNLIFEELEKQIEGDVILWNTTDSPPYHNYKNAGALYFASKGKIVLNEVYRVFPLTRFKYYQYAHAHAFSDMNLATTIIGQTPSDILVQMPKQNMDFPIIAKPSFGSKGDGIYLLKTKEELEKATFPIGEYIFQNFIDNDGDYRVFAIGGVPLGMVRRVSGKESFLNNLSQGGSAHKITDPHQRTILQNIASEAATLFQIHTAGVDIMHEPATTKYYFQEVNTIPNWSGSQPYLDVDMAEEVISLAVSAFERTKKRARALVEENYKHYHKYLGDEEISWAWLMAGHSKKSYYKKILKQLLQEWLARDEQAQIKWTNQLFDRGMSPTGPLSLSKEKQRTAEEQGLALTLQQICIVYDQTGISFLPHLLKTKASRVLKRVLKEYSTSQEALLESEAKGQTLTLLAIYGKQLGIDTDIPTLSQIEKVLSKKTSISHTTYFTSTLLMILLFAKERIHSKSSTYKKILGQLTKELTNDYFSFSAIGKLSHIFLASALDEISGLDSVIYRDMESSMSAIGNFIVDPMLEAQAPANSFIRSTLRSTLFVLASPK